jgi:hypothetical protein
MRAKVDESGGRRITDPAVTSGDWFHACPIADFIAVAKADASYAGIDSRFVAAGE